MPNPAEPEFKPTDEQRTLLEVGSESKDLKANVPKQDLPQDRTVANADAPQTMFEVTPGKPQAVAAGAAAPREVKAPSGVGQAVDIHFGNVRATQLLGVGGMGKVYRGHHEGLDIDVAIKVMSAELARDLTARQRFMREARTAAKLDHPHVVRVLTVDEQDGAPYIVMEFVDGSDLAGLVKQAGRLQPIPTLMALAQVADGLAAAHEQGIIHRDIKPHNIFAAKNGRVKLGDFGLARATEQTTELTMPGSAMGTAHYMSPEQASGHELSPKSDIYSLGVTAYHLLSGVTPYTGTTPLSIAVQHVNNDVPYDRARFGHVPDAAVYFLIAMTARDANRRPSAADVSRELRRILMQLTGRDEVRLPGIAALTQPGVSLSQPVMTAVQSPVAPQRPPTNFGVPQPQAPTVPPGFAPTRPMPPTQPPAFSTPPQPMHPGFTTQPPSHPMYPVPQQKSSNAMLWVAIIVIGILFLMFAACAVALGAH